MTEQQEPRFKPYKKKWGSKLKKVTHKYEHEVDQALGELSAEQTKLAGRKISQSKIANDLIKKDKFIRDRVKEIRKEQRNEAKKSKESATTS